MFSIKRSSTPWLCNALILLSWLGFLYPGDTLFSVGSLMVAVSVSSILITARDYVPSMWEKTMSNFLHPLLGWFDYLVLKVALCSRLLCVCWYVVFCTVLCFGFILSMIFLLVCASVCLACRLFCKKGYSYPLNVSKKFKYKSYSCLLNWRKQFIYLSFILSVRIVNFL